MTAIGETFETGGIKQKGKMTLEHGQQCGDCRREEGIRGLTGDRNNTIKMVTV